MIKGKCHLYPWRVKCHARKELRWKEKIDQQTWSEEKGFLKIAVPKLVVFNYILQSWSLYFFKKLNSFVISEDFWPQTSNELFLRTLLVTASGEKNDIREGKIKPYKQIYKKYLF